MPRNKKNQKVLVAMSGGIDSAVVAYLLKKQGYDCIGIHLRFWTDPLSPIGIKKIENKCCSTESMVAARKTAELLHIPFSVIDVSVPFKKNVVDYFMDEYKQGRTPNPCIECNRFIKFGELIDIADDLHADFVATGHYAIKSNYSLSAGKDSVKDQSYFLYTLTQKQLKRALFPLGNYVKSQTREIAAKNGLDKLISKKESQNLCFFPDQKYTDFLKRHISKDLKPGPIKTLDGKQIGAHEGIALYTIGQRKNLGGGSKEPIFVCKIDPKTNTIYVGPEKDLMKSEFYINQTNWIEKPIFNKKLSVKIRYGAKPVSALLKKEKGKIKVKLVKPQRAVSNGQSAVFYKGKKVIGGGVISLEF